MEQVTLPVKKKEGSGKKYAKALRNEGYIPAVVYGMKEEAESIAVHISDMKPVKRHGYSENMIINLQYEGNNETVPAVLHDYQVHPISCDIIHMDFLRVNMKEKIHVHVPVKLKGEAKGIKQGGQIEQHLFEMTVECLPVDMPEFIMVDVTDLDASHSSLHVDQVALPAGIVAVDDPKEVVVTCHIKSETEEQEETSADAASADKQEEKQEPKAEK